MPSYTLCSGSLINTSNINTNSMRLHNFVLDQIKKHLELYNFSEINTQELSTSAFESTNLESTFPEHANLLKIYTYNQELNQLSIEILNTNNIEQDAYFIKMLDSLFTEKLKLENYTLKLNFQNYNQDENSQDWNGLIKLLQILSVSHVVNTNLTQTPEHSNKTIFEFISRELTAQNVFLGGERYVLSNNKENLACICAKIDLSQLITLAEKHQNKLLIPEKPVLHIIIPVSKEQKTLALLLADKLQSNLLSTDVILEDASISDMMAKANKLGAKYVLIVGEEEQRDGTVTVKNMQKGESLSVKQSEIISHLK